MSLTTALVEDAKVSYRELRQAGADGSGRLNERGLWGLACVLTSCGAGRGARRDGGKVSPSVGTHN